MDERKSGRLEEESAWTQLRRWKSDLMMALPSAVARASVFSCTVSEPARSISMSEPEITPCSASSVSWCDSTISRTTVCERDECSWR